MGEGRASVTNSQTSLERNIAWVHESHHFIFEKVNKGYEFIRRSLVNYGTKAVINVKEALFKALLRQDVFEVQSKVKTIENTDFEPMTRSSLSFLDDYRILSGIPVFILRQPAKENENEGGNGVASSSSQSQLESTSNFEMHCVNQENPKSVTCSVFCTDATLFISGHQDGSITVWDAEHGKLKSTLSGPHRAAIADLVFFKGSAHFLKACDFSGLMTVWDVSDSEKKPVIVNCSSNWERTRMPSVEGHWPQFGKNGRLLVYPVQVVLEKNPDRPRGEVHMEERVFSISSMNRMSISDGAALSKGGRHAGVFAHFCILHIFNTRDVGITRDVAFGDEEGKEYCWGNHVELLSKTKLFVPLLSDSHDYALSSTEISYDSKGLLIGVSSRPDGHLIAWPDFERKPMLSYRLEGMVGRWSPCSGLIASWDSPLRNTLKSDPGACLVWKVAQFAETSERCTQNGEEDHPRFHCKESLKLTCPSGNSIYWSDFVYIAAKTADGDRQLGIATCSVGEKCQIVLWDIDMRIPTQTFFPGVLGKDITLHTQQAWADKWVLVKPSWGLNFITTSADRTRLGFMSVAANRGIIYDTEKRIERLWISFSDASGTVDPSLKSHMDMVLSSHGDRFVTLSEDTIMIWMPQVLQRMGERGASWVSLKGTDKEIEDGILRCQFSRDGSTVGLMRLYATVMDVWNLHTGQRIVLQHHFEHAPPRAPVAVSYYVDDDDELFGAGSPLSVVSPKHGVAANQKRWFCQFCISNRGDQVVTCMGDMSILLWDLTSDPPTFLRIAIVESRYCVAWAVCFVEGPMGHPDNVVVCEDTGFLVWIALHPYPRIQCRRNAGGKKRCTFSADGSRAVLMPDDMQVRVWDLIERVPLLQCTYRVWLGRSGQIPFPHNLSLDGKTALIGLDTMRDAVVCHPDTTYEELNALPDERKPCLIPQNLAVNSDASWFVTDAMDEFDLDAPLLNRFASRRSSQTSGRGTSAFSGGSSLRTSSAKSVPRKARSHKHVVTEGDDGTRLEKIDSGTTSRDTMGRPLYPNIKERLANDHLWDYLRNRSMCGQDFQEGLQSDKLMVIHSHAIGITKQVTLPGLDAHRFIVLSDDGTKIACMDRQNKLNVFSAHATNGCIPVLQTLLANGRCIVEKLERDLDIYGPGLLNYQDCNGLTPLLYAVYTRNVPLLKCLLSWAKSNGVNISLRDELVDQSKGTQALNALNLALGYRSPEVTRSIMKYLLEGVCTEMETSLILQDSLVKLSGVYPSILLKILDNKRIMMRLCELTVPEWAFARSEYKVVASDQLIPTEARLEEMWLKERLAKRDTIFTNTAFKRTSAYAVVMPYPDIAQVGMRGILRPLLFNKVPHHVFATWPIRAVIKFKWALYGKRLIVEDCVHYVALLFFFTLYALLIGFLVDRHEDKNVNDSGFYDDGTIGVLTICVVLSFGTLLRKFHQMHVIWQSGRWRGIWYWTTDYFNVIEILCYFFIVVLVPLAHVRSPTSRLLASVVATTCILLWSKTLYYAQAFKGTGPLVIMIREIVKDIRFYLFLMFAILTGFAISFFVLFRNSRITDNVNADGAQTSDNMSASEEARRNSTSSNINDLFGSFDRTMITMFSMMLGEVSEPAALLFEVDPGLKLVGIVMYIFYMLAVTIVLLNLLIAIMGDGFDRVRATDMSYFLKKRAQIIDDMETGLTKDRAKEISAYIGTYLHVLMPKHKSEAHQQTGEWQGRMRDVHQRFKRDVMLAVRQSTEAMIELRQHQLKLDRKIDEILSAVEIGAHLPTSRVVHVPTSMTPSRGHGGALARQTQQDVSDNSEFEDLFGDESDADTV